MKPLRILHVIPSFAPAWRYGGPIRAAYDMTRGLAARGHAVTVLTTNVDGPGVLPVPVSTPVLMEGARVRYFALDVAPLFFSYGLERALEEELPAHDVLHVHSIFLRPCSAAMRAASALGVPYILRPAGSLDPAMWANDLRGPLDRFVKMSKKEAYWQLFGRREVERAAAVQFTSETERAAAAPRLGATRAAVIPLGVHPPPENPEIDPVLAARIDALKGRPVLVFLSRIDPKKGLDLLIEAVAELTRRGRRLGVLVAGGGDAEETARVDALIAARGLDETFVRVGPVEGDARWQVLRAGDAFVLPSRNENFGLAVVEALACGVPALISDQVAVAAQVRASGAGIASPLELGAWISAIETVLDRPDERARMAAAARRCFEENFTWDRALDSLEALYRDCAAARGPGAGMFGPAE